MRELIDVSRTPKPDAFEPYRQGSLDGLCGLYAAVNAIRLITDPAERDDHEKWADLFGRLLLAADALVGLHRAMTAGIKRKQLVRIIEATLADATDLPTCRLRRPFMHQLDWTDDERERLAWFVQESQTAVIVMLRLPSPHWTVLREIDGDRLILLDSAALSSIAEPCPPCSAAFGVGAVEPRAVIVVGR